MMYVTKYEAPWCGSCKQMKPLLDKLVGDGIITLNTVDISIDPQAAQVAAVRSVPTLIVYDNVVGQVEVGRFYSVSPDFLAAVNVKQE